MEKPKIYSEYLRWCDGDDMPEFENTPIDDIKKCMVYEEYLKSKKGKVIRMIKN